MKKTIYLLITLTLLFTTINVKASTNTYDRTKDNNYGVNKHWTIDSKNIGYVKSTPLVNADELIYDFSDILTEEEEEKYYELFKQYKEKYNMDIVFLSYNLPYTVDSQNEDFAADFYDFNDFGIDFKSYNGVLLFRNTYEADPYYDMYSFGDAQLYYPSNRMSNILDRIYNNMHNGNYSNALDQWLRQLDYYHNKGPISGYYVDENSYLRKKYNPLILPILIIDTIITTIFIVDNVKKNKMIIKATNADNYLNKFNIIEKTDTLVSSHTTEWTESDSSSGGSSGGGYHSSGGHSGGGHSSGGGRHG